MMEVSKLRTYRFFKSDLELEKYLLCVTHTGHMRSLAKFSCSSHKLAIESQRGIIVNREDRICRYCLSLNGVNVIEDEYHVLFICPLYSHIRRQYLHASYYAHPNMHSFYKLMTCKNTQIIKRLAHYIHVALLIHQQFTGA